MSVQGHRRHTSLLRAALLLASWGALLSGCGGGMDFGGRIQIPAEQQHAILAGQATGASLSLPTDRPFNIHVKNSSQDPGSQGRGHGKSDATADGQAFAQADADDGGSAVAQFRIGHRLDNQSGQTQAVAIQVQFDLAEGIKASEVPKPQTLAKGDLQLVVLDSRNRTVARLTLVQTTSDAAVSQSSHPEHCTLTTKFEPNNSYDVVLFGRVEATTAPGQEAAARIAVAKLKMDLTFSVAQTQPATKSS